MNDNDYVILYKEFVDNQDIQNVENKHIRFNEAFNKSQKNLNIFYILPRTIRDEASHSQFLTWLLNPEASHGLGYTFLDKFLSKSVGIEKEKFIRIDNEKKGNKSAKKIDILIELSDSLVCIENKVDSNEGKTQLNDYIKILKDDYPLKDHKFIYLTPKGEEPSNEIYHDVSYSLIFEILKEIFYSKNLNSLNAESIKHIKDYVNLIYQDIGNIKDEFNDDAYEICLKYRNLFEKLNNYEFDKKNLIKKNPGLKDTVEHMLTNYKNIVKIIKETGIKNIERKKVENVLIKLLERENLFVTYCNDSYVRFITKDMKEYFHSPSLRQGWHGGKWLFSFEFFLSMGKKRIEFQAVVPSKSKKLNDYRKKIEPIIKRIKGFDKHEDWEAPDWPHYHKIVNLNYPSIPQDKDAIEIEEEIFKLIKEVEPTVNDYEKQFKTHKQELLEMKEIF